MLKEIRRGIHDSSEDELMFILGDFNAHLGIIGDQDVNYNGKNSTGYDDGGSHHFAH